MNPNYAYKSFDQRLQLLEDFLEKNSISDSATGFINAVSTVYHGIESGAYESSHSEIFESLLEEHWARSLNAIANTLPAKVAVLDYGCGTGFAAMQVIKILGVERVGTLVCVDSSAEMLNICRSNHNRNGVNTIYVHGTIDDLVTTQQKFDLVVTNSVLHHIFDIERFLHQVQRLLNVHGYYIAGHEPNAAVAVNTSVVRANRIYRTYQRFLRNIRPKGIAALIVRKAKLRPIAETHAQRVNNELRMMGYLSVDIPESAIRRSVDIHVPQANSSQYRWGLDGLDLKTVVDNRLETISLLTYNHIKHVKKTGRLSAPWRWWYRYLERKYPYSGIDQIAIFRRIE